MSNHSNQTLQPLAPLQTSTNQRTAQATGGTFRGPEFAQELANSRNLSENFPEQIQQFLGPLQQQFRRTTDRSREDLIDVTRRTGGGRSSFAQQGFREFERDAALNEQIATGRAAQSFFGPLAALQASRLSTTGAPLSESQSSSSGEASSFGFDPSIVQGQRGDQAIALQELRGEQSTGLQELRGEQSTGLQTLRGDQNTGLQTQRGDQALEQLGVTGAQDIALQELRGRQGLNTSNAAAVNASNLVQQQAAAARTRRAEEAFASGGGAARPGSAVDNPFDPFGPSFVESTGQSGFLGATNPAPGDPGFRPQLTAGQPGQLAAGQPGQLTAGQLTVSGRPGLPAPTGGSNIVFNPATGRFESLSDVPDATFQFSRNNDFLEGL